jgi:hypothetical protein
MGSKRKLKPRPTFDQFMDEVWRIQKAIPPIVEQDDDAIRGLSRVLPYIAIACRRLYLPVCMDDYWIDRIIDWERAMLAIDTKKRWPKPVALSPKAFIEKPAWLYVALSYTALTSRGVL